MSRITAEVIPDPEGRLTFVVEIMHGSQLIARPVVPSRDHGEKFLITALAAIWKLAEDEGYIE